jgi:membrane protein YqaA with SNARE-associated domain
LEAYLSLFASSLVAATLIPAQSEALLVGLIAYQPTQVVLLILVASVGNVLGALINWTLGRFFAQSAGKRMFKDSSRLRRVTSWYERFGWITLLGSWLPIIGDPLTFCAGLMREPLWRFVLIVSFAKTGRYLVLGWLTVSSLS